MDEGRKRVLLIAASILAARKLAQYDCGARVPATVSAIADAIRWAEIMRAIDERWSNPTSGYSTSRRMPPCCRLHQGIRWRIPRKT
jgi:hypothetical protein